VAKAGGKIACLGWGSLIWRNGDLRCDGVWRPDGPELSVEFARGSRSGEVTLVVVEDGPSVPVLWSMMDVPNLHDAIESLRVREGRTRREWIGVWSSESRSTGRHHECVGAWASAKGLSAVIWTALPAKWGDDDRIPQLPEILAYLSGLAPETRALARTYILRAPPQITTPYRPALTAWAEQEV